MTASGLSNATGVLAATSDSDCEEATVTAPASADTWLHEDSPFANKGSDSILIVDAGSLNVDTGLTSGRARALVRFGLASGVPSGCVVESAKLRLSSPEENAGAKAEVVRLASGWVEGFVTWSDQPETIGPAASAWSREGYMQWNVTSQVQALYDTGANHGFLIRDANELAEAGGAHDFHSREKGEGPPELVIHFAPPSSGEEPGPPRPPVPTAVSCGQVLTQSTLVTNDLSNCPGDGLAIGAPGIIADLDGHTIDGVGLGTGIRNEGYGSVTVKNGTVQEFDYGVELLPETKLNVVELLTLQFNEVAGVEIFDAVGTDVRGNTIENNGDGIALVSGTTDTSVVENTITRSRGWGLLLRDSERNRLEHNSVTAGGDLGVGLEHASRNTLVGNTVAGNSDGGIELKAGSNGNRVEGNTLSASGDTGILVDESNRNELISNVAELMSDSGITLNGANDGVVRGNDLRSNPGGLEMGGSSRNLIQSNNASDTAGIGIELLGGSFANDIVLNTANDNGARGIYIADEALTDPGNVLDRNTASGNRSDGIVVAKGGHTITANVAHNNSDWGIDAAPGSIDGRGNVASGNGQPEQCTGVVCRAEWEPPETTITDVQADPSSRSASFRFTGSDSATPPEGLSFQCRLDSQAETSFTSCASPKAYFGLRDGSHTFEVRAVDRAGNADPSPASHTWTISAPPVVCPEPSTAVADADSWVDQSSPFANSGSDSILRVRSRSGSRNGRALVRFPLPTAEDCVVESATLRLYASSARASRSLRALRVAGGWSENAVTWSNQPATTGSAATTSSGLGYRSWNVTSQVRAMYAGGSNHGFLIRDASESASGAGAEQLFHSRESSENPPQLVLRFVPAGG